jgi:hypothetical protein
MMALWGCNKAYFTEQTEFLTTTCYILDGSYYFIINTLNYFKYTTSCEGETYLNVKIANPVEIIGIVNQIFKSFVNFKAHKNTNFLKQYHLMVLNLGK